MAKHIILFVALICAGSVLAKDNPPEAITAFCAKHFNHDIAGKGEPFNPTDVIKQGMPRRRIIDYFVTSTTSYLWYEHGGLGYHQHLIKFNTARPEEIQASYVFVRSKHSRILDLIKDSNFLSSHESTNREL